MHFSASYHHLLRLASPKPLKALCRHDHPMRVYMTPPTIHRRDGYQKWVGIVLLLILLLSTCTSVSAQIGSTDKSTVTHDMPRPSGDEALVMDMTATVLSSREKHRLAEKIKRFEASIDLQLLIASSVEEGHTRGYTPKEIATSLLNSWNMGSQPRNPSLVRNPMGGMLVLLVMDQNRIEIVFSKNLGHLFDEGWVHDLLYTLVIPYFRKDQYGDGLARIVDATQHRLDHFHKAIRQGKNVDSAGLSTGLHRQHGWTWDALSTVLGLGGGWILHDIFTSKGNHHNHHGGDETPLLPPSAPPPSPARPKFKGGAGGPFVAPHLAPVVVDRAHSSNSYFWNDLVHLLGRNSGSSHNGSPKSGGNNVHVHVGTSPSTPYTRIEESSSYGKLASTTKVNSEAILNSQNSPQPPPPPPPTMQKVDQRKVEPQLITEPSVRESMNIDKQSIIHQPTFLRSDQKQSFGVVPPKNPMSQKSQIQTTQKSTSSGGGASWFSSSSPTRASKRQTRTSLLSPSFRSSSGNGGGAGWSSSSLRSTPRSTRSSTSSTSSASSSSNRSSKSSSSSNGGGASW